MARFEPIKPSKIVARQNARAATVERINLFVDQFQPSASDPEYLAEKMGALLDIKGSLERLFDLCGFPPPPMITKKMSKTIAFKIREHEGAVSMSLLDGRDDGLRHYILSQMQNLDIEPIIKHRGDEHIIIIPANDMKRLETLFNPDWNARKQAQEEFITASVKPEKAVRTPQTFSR